MGNNNDVFVITKKTTYKWSTSSMSTKEVK
jgi:hypothetical protein